MLNRFLFKKKMTTFGVVWSMVMFVCCGGIYAHRKKNVYICIYLYIYIRCMCYIHTKK